MRRDEFSNLLGIGKWSAHNLLRMPPVDHPTVLPESYVVRIYRRHLHGPGRIAGTVEIVASGTERSFTNLRELQQILGLPIRRPNEAKPSQGGPP